MNINEMLCGKIEVYVLGSHFLISFLYFSQNIRIYILYFEFILKNSVQNLQCNINPEEKDIESF